MSTVRLLQDVNSPSTPGCQQSVYSRMSKAPSASLGSGALYRCSLLKRAPYQAAPSASLGSGALYQCSLLKRAPYQAAPSDSLGSRGSGALYQLFPALGHYMVKCSSFEDAENDMIRDYTDTRRVRDDFNMFSSYETQHMMIRNSECGKPAPG